MPIQYYSVSDFYKNLFGQKVYKLSIDGGCTCPNRDGSKGVGGCIFCSEGGSGEFAVSKNAALSVIEQLEKAKELVLAKSKARAFIAYFQNFTNTYGDFDRLSAQFLEAARAPQIVGVAIATRPDCLDDRMLDFLAELSERTFVQLEFGLQTSNENTAVLIRRGYALCDYDNAMKRVKSRAPKIHIVTHIIFGLPSETRGDMMKSVRHAVDCKTDGIKIAVLHILKGTALYEMYERGEISAMDAREYFELVAAALEIIPSDVVVHRLTGDGAKRILVAPEWTAQKRKVWNDMMRFLRAHG